MPEMIFAICTWNQPTHLQICYDSLAASYGELNEDNFYVINNHSNYKSPGPSRVFHNHLRPDSSMGYLSRSWNQGLLWGFRNTTTPQTEWVVLVQSDVVFLPDWYAKFKELTKDGNMPFIACAPGDQVMFTHISAFREIGWWDERFCSNGYQEFDYFMRAYLRLGRRCMIQGHGNQLIWNWPRGLDLITRTPATVEVGRPFGATQRLNPMLQNHLMTKWGWDTAMRIYFDAETLGDWTKYADEAFGSPETPRSPEQMTKIPKEYNWYAYTYLDDPRDYSHLYYAYVPLKSETLFTKG